MKRILCFALVCMLSCGDDNMLIEEAAGTITYDGIELNVISISAESLDTPLNNLTIRYLDIYFDISDGGLVQLGIQNVFDLDGLGCIKERTYAFTPEAVDCFSETSIDFCEQAYCDFTDNVAVRRSGFLKMGKIIVNNCINNRISGKFSGMIGQLGILEEKAISGTFKNVLIE